MRALAHAFLVAVACAAAGAALAHHSVANFDFTKSATVTGTVQYFSFTSPHSFIDLQVRDSALLARPVSGTATLDSSMAAIREIEKSAALKFDYEGKTMVLRDAKRAAAPKAR